MRRQQKKSKTKNKTKKKKLKKKTKEEKKKSIHAFFSTSINIFFTLLANFRRKYTKKQNKPKRNKKST